MRKIVSAIAAVAAVSATALTLTPAAADTPPATVTFKADGYRLVGEATHLPPGRKACGFDRSQPNPALLIGSFGNDMITVGNRVTSGDAVTIKSRYLPRGRYLVRMSCFVWNRRTQMHTIVAVDEQWISITGRRWA
ncbi:hypothetical protein [Gordonia sp. (in: high G+C Gram-positive bacteria)]|uniref:hypothetical protein n=1 Tax=Gordonia sp. (in: high G+C Gram-positive bacteria) TaxID=84139 RepID=UPI0039E2E495